MKRYYLLPAVVCSLLGACEAGNGDAVAVGELASDRIELSAEVSEPVVEIAVAEGRPVAAGQLLLRQDAARAEARLAEAEAALAQQQARLDELVRGPRKERIDAARANLEGATEEMSFRQSEAQRIGDIYRKGLASAETLDLAKVALDTARANRKLREAQLQEALSGTTVEELAQAEQLLAQLAARRDSVRIDLERHALYAPVDGILDSRLFEMGERPSPGQPVLVVLGGSQPYARVFVPEHLRALVSAGSNAIVHVDGVESALDGRVRWVSSEAAFTPYYALTERDRGRLSYVAKVDILGQRERLPDGVPVEVEFLTDRAGQ
jgi:HlyD family secretion protein